MFIRHRFELIETKRQQQQQKKRKGRVVTAEIGKKKLLYLMVWSPAVLTVEGRLTCCCQRLPHFLVGERRDPSWSFVLHVIYSLTAWDATNDIMQKLFQGELVFTLARSLCFSLFSSFEIRLAGWTDRSALVFPVENKLRQRWTKKKRETYSPFCRNRRYPL